ncbi:hypothetical protein VTN00DRAFT_8564 [Thermoascus crustaceus]|uniref:uncharacterized protein n=1 Tax=Thermoascus crustaceus TaxID=5088 RepID=UPI003743FCFD
MKLLSIFAAILAVIVVEAVAIPGVHNGVPVEDSLAKPEPNAEAADKHAAF